MIHSRNTRTKEKALLRRCMTQVMEIPVADDILAGKDWYSLGTAHALNFEKQISKNAELRAKFENDTQKYVKETDGIFNNANGWFNSRFMASEADLDSEIKSLAFGSLREAGIIREVCQARLRQLAGVTLVPWKYRYCHWGHSNNQRIYGWRCRSRTGAMEYSS